MIDVIILFYYLIYLQSLIAGRWSALSRILAYHFKDTAIPLCHTGLMFTFGEVGMMKMFAKLYFDLIPRIILGADQTLPEVFQEQEMAILQLSLGIKCLSLEDMKKTLDYFHKMFTHLTSIPLPGHWYPLMDLLLHSEIFILQRYTWTDTCLYSVGEEIATVHFILEMKCTAILWCVLMLSDKNGLDRKLTETYHKDDDPTLLLCTTVLCIFLEAITESVMFIWTISTGMILVRFQSSINDVGWKLRHATIVIFFFVLESGEWKSLKPCGQSPGPRRRQGCVVIDNRVFFFGGTANCWLTT